MPEEKNGTENIEKVIDYGVGLANDIQTAGSDGEVNWKDAPLFLDDLVKIPGIIKAAPALKAEFLDLDEAERTKIKLKVADKFDCKVEEVETVVERAFNVSVDASVMVQDIISLAEAIKALKDLKKAQTE